MRILLTLLAVVGLPLFLYPSNSYATAPSVGKIRWAYYAGHTQDSRTLLQQHIGSLDYVSPFWFSIDGDGNIGGSDDPVASKLLKEKGVKNLPAVKNSAINADFHRVLADSGVRAKAIGNIITLINDKQYDGINIDFEWVDPSDRDNLTAFMADLSSALKPKGKLVTMAVAAKDKERTTGFTGPYDYAALSQYNDLILLMAYGYHSASGTTTGSTAPFKWVEGSVAYAVSQIPAEKVILGVAWYGYDWNISARTPAQSLNYGQAMDIAGDNNVPIDYDEADEAPHFQYSKNGQQHEVWFENQRSVDARLELVNKYGIAGAGGWRMGQEDPGVWQSFDARLGFRTWYLAEGSTGKPYQTWILIQNPNLSSASAKVTFMKEDGSTVVRSYLLNPQSRLNIFANEIVPNSAISTKVESNLPVIVERAMYFGHDGHSSPGVNAGSRDWYLPEGYTGSGNDTWVLLMNPNSEPTNCTVTFMKEDGNKVVKTYSLKPTSRLNIFANQIVPGTSFATSVSADKPIVAERATYFDGGKGGHGSVGSTYTAKSWYLAEGTGNMDTWVLVMNPGKVSANATISFLSDTGRTVTKQFTLKPTSRLSIHANNFISGAFATKIDSDQPVVAERSMYWSGGSSGHSSVGTSYPARTWYLAEGSTADPFTEWLLLENPNAAHADVTLTFMLEGGGTVVRNVDVLPTSRYSLLVNDVVPNKAVSVRVDSDRPVVAERSMYMKSGGGTNSMGLSQ